MAPTLSNHANQACTSLYCLSLLPTQPHEEITISSRYARSLLPSPPPPPTSLFETLSLQLHPEGGAFTELDRDPLLVPSPFSQSSSTTYTSSTVTNGDPAHRNASTTILYHLSPHTPIGHFHRNKARTVHTLIWGRGRYVLIHADEVGPGSGPGRARVETFVVGTDVERGERVTWIVDGGKFKASFLLPDGEGGESARGLLISETVVPGFEFADHDFLTAEGMEGLLGEEGRGLSWLLNKGERERMGVRGSCEVCEGR